MVEDKVDYYDKKEYCTCVATVQYTQLPSGKYVAEVHDYIFTAKSFTECAVLVAEFLGK